MSSDGDYEKIKLSIKKVIAESNCDIILFNSEITPISADQLHQRLKSISRPKKSIMLILVTLGGDAHAAYMIARELQMRYEKVTICIAGDCYSAGTLIVLSGHELVIFDQGKLGPLDVQIIKKDELRERVSGLAIDMSLKELNKRAAEAVIGTTLQLKSTFGPQLAFRTALELSCNIVSHTFGEIYRQIDPIRIGEDARALRIAGHYGNILGGTSTNLKPGAIDRLLEFYPSHECIIDNKEAATELFKNVRQPSEAELDLIDVLGSMALDAQPSSIILRLYEGDTPVKEEENGGNKKEQPEESGDEEKPATSCAEDSENSAAGNGDPAKE